MRIIFLSDTHEKHERLRDLPPGEMIIHSGDISDKGTAKSIDEFIAWYSKLNYTYKIFIGGNHDFFFEKHSPDYIQSLLPKNMFYLSDSGIKIEGIHFWGSPVTPWFHNWAFNKKRGEEILKHWELIPSETDILITHGPPYGILDKNEMGELIGCKDLLNVVQQIKPKYHLFGHIHEGHGIKTIEGTTFINGCVLNENNVLKNKPLLFTLNV